MAKKRVVVVGAGPGGLTAVDGTGATKYLKPVSFAEYTVKDAAGHVLQFNTAASAGAASAIGNNFNIAHSSSTDILTCPIALNK